MDSRRRFHSALVAISALALLLAMGAGALLYGQTSSASPGRDQPYRPQYHFSPLENWTNDPNGLVYFEGEYHLFFQYNPFGDQWGHMTWGHAVSPDLVHWQQLPPAIPEENGIMIFTGSTVVDAHNTSGFCTGGKPCMVAIYTGHTPAAAGRPGLQTQNLAYSNDRGRHWTKYPGNPVLDLHMRDFRDPKVLWFAQTACWVMLVSLPNEHKVRTYQSSDLKHWTPSSDFGPAGATGGQWECPELFEVPVEGGHDTRWVLKVGLNPGALQGGSGEQYFIGHFDGSRFTNDNPPSRTLWTDYGKDCYCALTFNNLPRGRNPVMIGWMDNWQYARDLPTKPWRGQMTFPRSLSLRNTSDGLRLVQTPAAELASIENRSPSDAYTGDMDGANRWLLHSAAIQSGTFQLTTDISVGTAQQVALRLLSAGTDYAAVLNYDRQAGKLFFERPKSAAAFSPAFPVRIEAPLALENSSLHLNILVDRNSLEIFAENGLVTSTNLVFPSPGAHRIEFYATGGTSGKITIRSTPVRSIWAAH